MLQLKHMQRMLKLPVYRPQSSTVQTALSVEKETAVFLLHVQHYALSAMIVMRLATGHRNVLVQGAGTIMADSTNIHVGVVVVKLIEHVSLQLQIILKTRGMTTPCSM